jgi:threonylcarbamoyladenosine tRNA methylthiotransferase MtaB
VYAFGNRKMNKIITFGCRLNTFESELIRRRLAQAGIDGAIVLHTCAVTAEAERQARQVLRRTLKENPSAKVIVAGCSAERMADGMAKIGGVFAVLGNAEKLRRKYYDLLARADAKDAPFVFAGELASGARPKSVEFATKDDLSGFDGKTKAFVQIQQGCNNRCSYCVVPLVRGRNISFSEASVLTQCRAFLKMGYREIVLTGVDISAYGTDTRTGSLFRIVKRILEANPSLERLRLSSLDPAKNYDQLLGLMAEDGRLMPHLHLSLQSGDDKVLSDMRRRHSGADILALVKKIRKTDRHIAIGADVIVGFPGETEREFENTCRLIEKCGISHLHVFPYSVREGTRAASMLGQLRMSVKKERASKLRTLGEKLKCAFIRGEKGRELSVLVEKSNCGYTENYIFVEIAGETVAPNSIVKAKIFKIGNDGRVVAKRI